MVLGCGAHGNRMLAKARRGISQVCLEVRFLRIRMMRTAHRTHIYIRAFIQYQQLSNPLTGRADRLPPTLHDHHTLLTFCEFQQAHAYCIAPYVPMTHVLTASRRLSTHACTAHETLMHMPHVTSYFYDTPSTSTVWTVWTASSIRAYHTSFYFV